MRKEKDNFFILYISVFITSSTMYKLVNDCHSTMVLNDAEVCGVKQNKTKDL